MRELWAHYHAEHQRLRGVAPVFTKQQRGGVGKAWKGMLEAVSLDEAKAIVSRALADGFHVQPLAILGALNRYRGIPPRKATSGPVQRGGTIRTGDPSWLDAAGGDTRGNSPR